MAENRAMTYKKFQKEIWMYYRLNKRDFPWRRTRDPYKITVSEVMLQQTQTDRVMPKYALFINRFPDFQALAKAPTAAVLVAWQGLGYNRRAIYLKRIAEAVADQCGGNLPTDLDALDALPGIGRHTAGSIAAFAFNKPALFIETNIRRVFIHFFFSSKRKVDDSEIMPLLEKTLDSERPREWYYALMDYGAMLGKKVSNPNRRSAHYRRQSRFEGSRRQLRGAILRMALRVQPLTLTMIVKETKRGKTEVIEALRGLEKENFIKLRKSRILLTG